MAKTPLSFPDCTHSCRSDAAMGTKTVNRAVVQDACLQHDVCVLI